MQIANKKEIISNPDFFSEALNCYTAKEDHFSIIENHEKFGMTLQEMKDYIEPIQLYCKKIKEEFSIVLEKFPKIKGFLKLTETEQNEGSILLIFYRNLFRVLEGNEEYTREEIAFFHMLNKDHYSEDISEENVVLKDVSELIHFLDGQEFEDATKMRIINLYMDRVEISRQLEELKKLAEQIVRKHYPVVKALVEEELSHMCEEDYLDEVLKEALRIHVENGKKVVLIPSISMFNSLGMEYVEGITYFYVGIYVVNLVKRSNQNRFNDAQLVADLKAISDTTRLKILHMLSMKRMYIQEMAENLSLTPATISHHINILLSEGYVLLTVDASKSKKVFYELSQEKLEGLSQSILNLANKNY